MNLNGIHWLEKQVAGFGHLKDEEKSEIIDFCMLWSFFEGKFLNENANVDSIRTFARKLEQNELLAELLFDDCVNYFRDRYVQNNGFTDNYRSLNLDRNGNPAEVSEMLTNYGASAAQSLIGCLIIIYRFRNNLFHGVKWQYNFHGQLDNFTHANSLLMKLIKLD